MRVLVVEDEIRQAAALKRGLEAEGFAVDVAANGHRRAVAGDRAALRRDRARRDAARASTATRSAPSCGPARSGRPS